MWLWGVRKRHDPSCVASWQWLPISQIIVAIEIGVEIGVGVDSCSGWRLAEPVPAPETYTYTAKRYTFTYTRMWRVRVRVRVRGVADPPDPSDPCRNRSLFGRPPRPLSTAQSSLPSINPGSPACPHPIPPPLDTDSNTDPDLASPSSFANNIW